MVDLPAPGPFENWRPRDPEANNTKKLLRWGVEKVAEETRNIVLGNILAPPVSKRGNERIALATKQYQALVKKAEQAHDGESLSVQERSGILIDVLQKERNQLSAQMQSGIMRSLPTPVNLNKKEQEEWKKRVDHVAQQFSAQQSPDNHHSSYLEMNMREMLSIEMLPIEQRVPAREEYLTEMQAEYVLTRAEALALYFGMLGQVDAYQTLLRYRTAEIIAGVDPDLSLQVMEAQSHGDTQEVDRLVSTVDDPDVLHEVITLREFQLGALQITAQSSGLSPWHESREIATSIENPNIGTFVATRVPMMRYGGSSHGIALSVVPVSYDKKSGTFFVNGSPVNLDDDQEFFGAILRTFFDNVGADALTLMEPREAYALVNSLLAGRTLSDMTTAQLTKDLINMTEALNLRSTDPQGGLSRLRNDLHLLSNSGSVDRQRADRLGGQYRDQVGSNFRAYAYTDLVLMTDEWEQRAADSGLDFVDMQFSESDLMEFRKRAG